MPIFGTSILSFIPTWTSDGGQYAIKKTAEYGFAGNSFTNFTGF